LVLFRETPPIADETFTDLPLRSSLEVGFEAEMTPHLDKPWWERAASGLVIGGACVLMAAVTVVMGIANG
jgi:hypothetical protein